MSIGIRISQTDLLRSFADAASPWEQTGAGNPNTQPEVRTNLLNMMLKLTRQNFKIPPPPPKEEGKDEKK